MNKSYDMESGEAKVLIVDDAYTNVQVLARILRTQHYHVTMASNAEDAYDILESNMPDIVLLDIMMPDIDGFEVCDKIKSDEKFKHIPVIFISALEQKEYTLRGFKVGAADYITKPFDAEIVIARVKTHLKLKFQAQELKKLNVSLEKKVAERTALLREANEKLINLDDIKSEFLQIISHEIRTPLNGIMGVTQLMQDKFGKQGVKKMFEVLNSSVQRLENFALDAIMFSHLRLNKYKLNIQSNDIFELISVVELNQQKLIHEKKLRVTLQISPRAKQFMADQKLIRKALNEVFKNAIQYTKPNSEVVIKTGKQNGNDFIEVKDNGEGFSEKSIRQLYTLFSPGGKFSDQTEGINLALCKLILEAHHGKITIDSANDGATVKLIFPQSQLQ